MTPTPKSKKEVQSFLGFCNFYWRFIKDFSAIAKPLTSLTGNTDWKWGIDQDNTTTGLKEALSSEPVLAIPIDNAPYWLEVDLSDFAQGRVLSQFINGKWHPVAYRSKSLSKTERNYEIYDKEMVAIMSALDDWRQYLLGASERFEIWSDHQNLQYFRKPQKLNRRRARWVTELAEYDFVLVHKPGTQMVKSDLLSRRAGHEKGENDNLDVTMLKNKFFVREIILETPEEDLLKRIKRVKDNQDRIVIIALAKKEAKWVKHDDGLITWQDRIYVPRDSKLREDIIRLHHDTKLAGHPGHYKTQELITRNYWWPGIQRDIWKYITGCDMCQRTKNHREKPHAPLQPNEIPKEPW